MTTKRKSPGSTAELVSLLGKIDRVERVLTRSKHPFLPDFGTAPAEVKRWRAADARVERLRANHRDLVGRFLALAKDKYQAPQPPAPISETVGDLRAAIGSFLELLEEIEGRA